MEIRGPLNPLSLPAPERRTSAPERQRASYAQSSQEAAAADNGAEKVHQGEVLERGGSTDYAALLRQARTTAGGGTQNLPEAGTTTRARKAVVAYRQQALLGDLGGGELVRVDSYV